MKNKQHQRRGGPGTWHRTHMERQASGCRSLIKSPEFLAIFVWWTDTCVHITDSETICHGECRQFPSKMSWPSWTKSRWKAPKLSSAEVLNIKILRIWLDFLISIRINHTFNRLIPDYIIYTFLFLIAIYHTNTKLTFSLIRPHFPGNLRGIAAGAQAADLETVLGALVGSGDHAGMHVRLGLEIWKVMKVDEVIPQDSSRFMFSRWLR